jgi:hypothetical protein
MKSADELIRRFLAAGDEDRAGALLARLLDEHADRAIKNVVRRKLRVDLDRLWRLDEGAATTRAATPMKGRAPGKIRQERDAEDLYAHSVASLVAHLWDRKDAPNVEPIPDFGAYVHEIGVNAYRRLLRQQFPAYPCLRRKLLGLARGQPASPFALWPGGSPGEQIFGFRVWEGRPPRLTGGYWRWVRYPGELQNAVLLGDDPGALPFPRLVARILDWVGAPMDVDDLVKGLADLPVLRGAPMKGLADPPHSHGVPPEAKDGGEEVLQPAAPRHGRRGESRRAAGCGLLRGDQK